MREFCESKVAVVTGGASGIGLALCEAMLSHGAKAIVLADIHPGNLAREAAPLGAKFPGRAFAVETDVTSRKDVETMVARAVEVGGGRLDLLVNNAGLGLSGAFDDTTDEDWKRAFDINFYSALYYSIHEEWPVPPEAISIDQAGIEILAGLKKGMAILPIVDFAREMHGCVFRGEPARIDATMRAIAGNVRARLEAMAPPRR